MTGLGVSSKFQGLHGRKGIGFAAMLAFIDVHLIDVSGSEGESTGGSGKWVFKHCTA
jgi:hypothetical protein